MRFKLIPSRHSMLLRYIMYETHMKGNIESTIGPQGPMDAITKKLVDESKKNLPPENIKGTFKKNQFPEYVGDFVKNKEDDYVLKDKVKEDTTHLTVSTTDKGLLDKGGNELTKDMWENIKFERIDKETLPDDLEALGVTNAIPLDGTGFTLTGFHYKGKKDIKKRPIMYGDINTDLSHLNMFRTGDIIAIPRDLTTNVVGWYKANAGAVPKKGNEKLYGIVGDYFGMNFGKYGNGQPWRNLNNISKVAFPAKPTVASIPGREPGVNIGGSATFLTNGKVYSFGGHRGNRRAITNNAYVSLVDVNGNLVGWKTTTALPKARTDARAVAFAGNVYIVGGSQSIPGGNVPISVLRSKVAADGSLGAWVELPVKLPRSLCNAAVFVHKRRLYVAGGKMFTGRFLPDAIYGEWPEVQNNTFVYYANIYPDGSIGEFKIAAEGVSCQEGFTLTKGNDVTVASGWETGGSIVNNTTTASNSFALGKWQRSKLDAITQIFTGAIVSNDVDACLFMDTGNQPSGVEPYLSGSCIAYATGKNNGNGKGLQALTNWQSLYDDRSNRVYFDVVVTGSKIQLIGGCIVSGTYNHPTEPGTVVRDINIAYTGGKNNYLPYFDSSTILEDVPKDKFILPDLPDERYLINGKEVWYSFFIKA